MGRKPKLPPDKMKALILDAARSIYFSEGPDALSARNLAERIGFSATVIYLHFAGMPEILSALREEGFIMLERLLETVSQGADPLERFVRRVLGLYEFLISNPGYYRLMFQPGTAAVSTELGREIFARYCAGLDQDVRALGGSGEGRMLTNLVLGCVAREFAASELGEEQTSQVGVLRGQLERVLASLMGER